MKRLVKISSAIVLISSVLAVGMGCGGKETVKNCNVFDGKKASCENAKQQDGRNCQFVDSRCVAEVEE